MTDIQTDGRTELPWHIRAIAYNMLSRVKKIGHGTSIVAECNKQATVVDLLLTIIGDGGRGQALSTVDRRPSPVDHTQRPALSTVRRAIGCDATRRMGSSAPAESYQISGGSRLILFSPLGLRARWAIFSAIVSSRF